MLKRDCLVAAIICTFVGMLVSALPHLLWWVKTGSPAWIGSYDELVCYYPVSCQAYHSHPASLSDPTFATGGATMFPWLQLVPGILTAKVLGWGPLGIGMAWRLWAGFSVALGFFLVSYHFLKSPWIAALVSGLLMVDAGMIWSRPIVNHTRIFAQMWQANPPEWFFSSYPVLLLQWRLITPGLSLFYLLFHLWLVARAREQPSRGRIALAGLSFGLLFYAYFYFWTAAGLALALALLVDFPQRKVYFHTGWIGGLAGLPLVFYSAWLNRVYGMDWLQRYDKFVPIPRFSELLISKGAILMLGVGLIWVLLRRRDWSYLWAVATAGFLLVNHQIVTGLQIENGHWGYVWGIGLSLFYVLWLAEALLRWGRWSSIMKCGLLALCGFHLMAGVWFRVLECTRSRQMLEIQANYARYQEQRTSAPTQELAPNTVIAGDPAFVDFAGLVEDLRPLERSASLSPRVTNEEWDARVALNSYLEGKDAAAFAAEQQAYFRDTRMGPWTRDPQQKDQRLRNRFAFYREVSFKPEAWLNRFGVRYVALRASAPSPAYLSAGWRRVQTGPHWDIWERTAGNHFAR
ncbi:MAG: hypothetical protein AAB466_01380 [Verrucomicrobiota bacterium]